MVIQLQIRRNGGVIYACNSISPTITEYGHIAAAVRLRMEEDESMLTVTEGSPLAVPGAGFVDRDRNLPEWPPVMVGLQEVGATERLSASFAACERGDDKLLTKIRA